MYYQVRMSGNDAVEMPGQRVELQTPLEMLLFDILMEVRRQNKGLYAAMGMLAKVARVPLPAEAKDLLGQRHGVPDRSRTPDETGADRDADK